MKSDISAAVMIFAFSLSVAYAADDVQKGDKAKKSDTGLKIENVMLMPAATMKWTDVPNIQGVKMAVAEGDSEKGPHHSFVRFNAGASVPEHHHSADYFTTVVSGTILMTVDGKEYRMPPGSFFSFKNKARHATKCDGSAECLLSIDSRGAWDVVPARAASR